MRHLDTNIAIAYLNGNQAIAARVNIHLPEVAISTVVWGELLYGARASARVAENLSRLEEFTHTVMLESFDQSAADAYGQLRLELRRKGRPSGSADIMIAAVALSRQAILVTNNTRHFQHMDGLTLEDWLSP